MRLTVGPRINHHNLLLLSYWKQRWYDEKWKPTKNRIEFIWKNPLLTIPLLRRGWVKAFLEKKTPKAFIHVFGPNKIHSEFNSRTEKEDTGRKQQQETMTKVTQSHFRKMSNEKKTVGRNYQKIKLQAFNVVHLCLSDASILIILSTQKTCTNSHIDIQTERKREYKYHPNTHYHFIVKCLGMRCVVRWVLTKFYFLE